MTDEEKKNKKTEALKRAILRFIPKNKRGFMQIGASCIIATELDKYYLPWQTAKIIGYEITNAYGLVVICQLNYTKLEKVHNAAVTIKIHSDNVYHSVTDFVEHFYQTICCQIHNIQLCFSKNEFKYGFSGKYKKETAEMTVRKLVNIKRKVDEKRRKKFPPPAVDCRTLFEQK